MAFNFFLALIPVFLGAAVFKKEFTFIKFLGAIVWFFFLPNSIYLITDIVNLVGDIRYISGIYLLADAILFLVLIPVGIVTYVLSVLPFTKRFTHFHLFILNIFVGFGLILGRVQRVNSWEVVTNPQNVVLKSIEMLTSIELILLIAIMAGLCQVIYILFKDKVIKLVRT